ncbi:MAG TPA: hypothetical protein VHP33_09115 [Polyangiaceae bacterium]|nr:hypothetical protein [Polyangiaceae bacterium]
MHQFVDIRVRGARHHFIDAASEQEHMQRLAEFRAGIPKHVRYVVGPGTVVEGKDGKSFGSGAPIAVDDIEADVGYPGYVNARAAWQVFEALVHDERVIENYAFAPPDAT